VKSTSKRYKSGKKYKFRLDHGKSGHRHPYDVGIAFAFVVTTCTDRFYLVSAVKAKELKFVGKGAPMTLYLPHPDVVALDLKHEYFPILYLQPRV
jgi:hypothetical protein